MPYCVTLSGLSALCALRCLRHDTSQSAVKLKRTDLLPPKLGEHSRWSALQLSSQLTHAGLSPLTPLTNEHQLTIAVPDKSQRLRIKGVRNRIYSTGLPPRAFVSLGNDIYASSPELIFVETAPLMSPAVHVLLGMELCGCFSRHPENPRTGNARYFVQSLTTVKKLRTFIQSCTNVRGLQKAKNTLEYVTENAWSPIEAVIATLLVLPIHELGYDLGPIDLNMPIKTSQGASRSTRRPDILFRGTSVGLNYDGLDHVDLHSVVRAATQLALMPGQMTNKRELDGALKQARTGILEDKRRDRELMAQGIRALTVSKEDLFERGAFDRLVLQVISAIETESNYDFSEVRQALKNRTLARLRQDLLWSLLPISEGLKATARLKKYFATNKASQAKFSQVQTL